MLYFYLFVLLVIMGLSYKQNKKIIFVPSFVCCCSFIIAACFLFILKNKWQFDFSFYMINLIGIGLFSMLLGERFYQKKLSLNATDEYHTTFNEISSLKVNKWLTIFILIVNFIGSYLYFKEVLNIIGRNITALSEDMSYYRDATVFGGEKISRIVTQFKLFTNSTSLVFCFIAIFNMHKGESLKKNSIYIVACIPYVINTFLSGGRLGFLTFAASLLWFVYIINIIGIRKQQDYKKYILKYGKKIIVVLAMLLLLFFSLRLAVGRIASEDDSFSEYVGKYIAAPSINFEYFVQKYSVPSVWDFDIHKSDSFLGLGEILSLFDGKENVYNPLFEFRYGSRGENLGNVYTALARYYSDLGILGIILLPFTIGLILGKILSYILNDRNKRFNARIIYYILLYGYLYNPLIIFAADDVFYRSFRHGTIEIVIMLFFMSKWMVKIQKNNKIHSI